MVRALGRIAPEAALSALNPTADIREQLDIDSVETDPQLTELAVRHMQAIGAGHTFLIFLGNAFPLNVLNAIKVVPEVCHTFCATADPVQVIVG